MRFFKITILQRKVKNNWQAMRKNCSRLFISISEDLDYLDAASQVWCNTSKNSFFEKEPQISI